jgi:hypothetical protein
MTSPSKQVVKTKLMSVWDMMSLNDVKKYQEEQLVKNMKKQEEKNNLK